MTKIRTETAGSRSLREAREAHDDILAAQPGLRPSHVAYLIERRGIDADAARLVIYAALPLTR